MSNQKEEKVIRKSTWDVGEVSFPLGEAFRISIENIKKRFARAAITSASVMLGIAFLVSLLLMASFQTVSGQTSGTEPYMYWLLFISLLVCGVGITNSMLIAVAERYKEIGTYKTLGALDRHVLELFLLEAIVIGTIGGLVGYFGGLIAAMIYAATNSSIGIGKAVTALGLPNPTIPLVGMLPSAVALFILGIGLAIILSLAATIYPAYYAAKLNPAEALRYEI
ncbi:MAG: ABC transporter permease [Thermoproteales archaeon]|nr:ABC transporter permease [Thermoproteales archaeon]